MELKLNIFGALFLSMIYASLMVRLRVIQDGVNTVNIMLIFTLVLKCL